jgi:UDP-N-acetylglucosamine acyltransferase
LPKVHPLAYVDSAADLADDIEIGPFCVVEAGVQIGPRTRLDSHVTIKSGATLGADNYVGQGAVLGGDPQDTKYKGEPTYLHIGDRNSIREYVTMHRATGEGQATTVGDDNYIMAYSHLGHNVDVHHHVIISSYAGVSGHCTLEEYVILGGMVGVHQFVRFGRGSMMGGFSATSRDVPPYTIARGLENAVHDINAVGLRRLGVSQESRMALHKAVKLLYKSQLGMTNAMEIVRREVQLTEEVEYLLAFEERRRGGKNGRGDQR